MTVSQFLVVAGNLGIPWLLETSPRSLPSSSHGVLCVCVCVQISPFYKDISHIGIGPPPWPHFNLIPSAKTPSLNKVNLRYVLG